MMNLQATCIQLFPQIFSDMLSELDFDSDGQISLEEWLKGGMNNIPLQVLLGLDVVCIASHFHYEASRISCIDNKWYVTRVAVTGLIVQEVCLCS